MLFWSAVLLAGCAASRPTLAKRDSISRPTTQHSGGQVATARRNDNRTSKPASIPPGPSSSDSSSSEIRLTSSTAEEDERVTPGKNNSGAELSDFPIDEYVRQSRKANRNSSDDDPQTTNLALDHVIDSIYQSYPLLRIALENRRLATGQHLAASGEFDLKAKAYSENTPLGFYQTYRQGVGLEQALMGGGTVFGGYRVGSGTFEPWYGNRQTDDGGEFKAGLAVPLWQNRAIDERRAQLWKAMFGVNSVEPSIQTELLEFVKDGSLAYWEWVAAGLQNRYADELLKLSLDRNRQLSVQVENGDRAEADLIDNQRLIVSREVKRLETTRKLQTTAVKLSLFFRNPDGSPRIPQSSELPDRFPDPQSIDRGAIAEDIAMAQARRPELQFLNWQRQGLEIDRQKASNEYLPSLDGTLVAGQDIGGHASSKRDKKPFEMEAGLAISAPLQRRKASGKIMQTEAKLAQNSAKRRYTSDKIATEVEMAIISLDTAFNAILKARRVVELNAEMERLEVLRLENGASDLLRINLREMATFDSRVVEIETLLRYYEALAEYRAATAMDLPFISEMAPDNAPEPGTLVETRAE